MQYLRPGERENRGGRAMNMPRTLVTGLQFLATSAGCTLVCLLCSWPVHGQFWQCPFQGFRAFLYLLCWLSGFLALATGLVAFIYLVGGGVECVGRLGIGNKSETGPGNQP